MKHPGLVMLNDDVVGTFTLDDEEKISIHFNKGASGVEDTLRFVAESGMTLSLMLNPQEIDEVVVAGI